MAVKLGLGGGQVQLAVALLRAQSLCLGCESSVGKQEGDQSMEGRWLQHEACIFFFNLGFEVCVAHAGGV